MERYNADVNKTKRRKS